MELGKHGCEPVEARDGQDRIEVGFDDARGGFLEAVEDPGSALVSVASATLMISEALSSGLRSLPRK